MALAAGWQLQPSHRSPRPRCRSVINLWADSVALGSPRAMRQQRDLRDRPQDALPLSSGGPQR